MLLEKLKIKKISRTRILFMMALFTTVMCVGCGNQKAEESNSEIIEENSTDSITTIVEERQIPLSSEIPTSRPADYTASSYNLGSASQLEGKQILVSVFLEDADSGFTEEEKQVALDKLAAAASYIEDTAVSYEKEVNFIYAEDSLSDLVMDETVDYSVSGKDDNYYDDLDASIAQWFNSDINYEQLKKQYGADGIATLVFVNNKGTSYAIVYDGEDNVKESMILFQDSATVYAHEILHVYGAHDLYKGAEYPEEVTSYLESVYPEDIMVSVDAKSQYEIKQKVTAVTAYELGWIDFLTELNNYPQLTR